MSQADSANTRLAQFITYTFLFFNQLALDQCPWTTSSKSFVGNDFWLFTLIQSHEQAAIETDGKDEDEVQLRGRIQGAVPQTQSRMSNRVSRAFVELITQPAPSKITRIKSQVDMELLVGTQDNFRILNVGPEWSNIILPSKRITVSKIHSDD